MTDPRGQRGTLVPLSQVEQYAEDPEAAGVIGGARGTEQAAIRAEALRMVRDGEAQDAAEAEAMIRERQAAEAAAAPAGGRAGGPGGRAGGPGGRAGGPGGRAGGPGGGRGGFNFGGGGSALTEAGQAALDARPTLDRYEMTCVFTSIATEWAGDSGEVVNRIVQRGDTISILYGRMGIERTIHMNMTEHPADIEPSVAGHSIGRWDGDTLIVDTVGFQEGLYNGRTPHSTELHLVEQFTFDVDARQLRRTYTATDPLYWTGELAGSAATDISEVPFFVEECEDLTAETPLELGPRD